MCVCVCFVVVVVLVCDVGLVDNMTAKVAK